MADNSANNKRIAKNSLYMSIRMIFVLLISLYTTRAVLKALGVEDYGVYNVVAGFVSMFAFLNNSMSTSTQRFFNFELGKNGQEGAQAVYNTAFIIHTVIALLAVIVAIPVGYWYLHYKMVLPDGRLFAAQSIFYCCIVSLSITILSVPYTAAIMAHEKMNYYAIVGMLDAVLKLAIVLVLPYLSGDQLIWYGGLLLAVTLLNFILYFVYSKNKFTEIRLNKHTPRHLFKPMLVFCGWGLVGSFSYIMSGQGINLLLNAFFGPAINAARGVAYQINGALNSFTANILTPARPQVIQAYSQGNFERTWSLTYSVSKLITLFFVMLALPLCLEIDFVLRLWLGTNVPQHTNWFVMLILFASVFGCLTSPISTIIHATGQVKFYHLLSSVSNLFSIPLAYVLLTFDEVPEYVFIAYALTMISNYIAAQISAKRYANFSFGQYTKRVPLPIICVILFASPFVISIFFLLPGGFAQLIAISIISALSFSLSTYFIGLNQGEREFVLTIFRKIFKRK